MQASIVEMRKRTREIIEALERGETVTILYRGRPTATMRPYGAASGGDASDVREHPAFGMWSDRKGLSDPTEYVRELRQWRQIRRS